MEGHQIVRVLSNVDEQQTTDLLFLPAELFFLETNTLARKLLRKDRGVPGKKTIRYVHERTMEKTYWVSEWTVLESFSVRYVSYSTS